MIPNLTTQQAVEKAVRLTIQSLDGQIKGLRKQAADAASEHARLTEERDALERRNDTLHQQLHTANRGRNEAIETSASAHAAHAAAEDEIAALKAAAARDAEVIARMREALKPFAKAGELFGEAVQEGCYDACVYAPAAGPDYSISANDLRRARAILTSRRTPMSEVMRAIDSIAAERRRQVEAEGWTPEHDDAHDKCELARAAACYALAPSPLGIEREWVYPGSPKGWPWSGTWWKPGFYRRNLVKAGALIVAEIERWDRLNGVVREHPVQGRDDHAAALASTTPETPSANLTEGAS